VGAPSLRFLQGRVRCSRLDFGLLSINPEANTFATPALRNEREERGTGVGDAGELKGWATRP
jgi:hypothetical protein